MAIDWTKIFKKYRGFWIALDKDESTVISANKTAKIAFKEAREKGFKNPIMTRVPEDLKSYVGIL